MSDVYDIHLANMPFTDPHLPSIGLTQLAAVAHDEFSDSVRVSIHYLNHDFAHFFDIDLCREICAVKEHHNVTDLIFDVDLNELLYGVDPIASVGEATTDGSPALAPLARRARRRSKAALMGAVNEATDGEPGVARDIVGQLEADRQVVRRRARRGLHDSDG